MYQCLVRSDSLCWKNLVIHILMAYHCDPIGQQSSVGATLPSPPRHTVSENIFGGHRLGRGGEGCYGYLAASKARSAAKHCTTHRTAAPLPSQQRNIKVNSAAVDKPCCRRILILRGQRDMGVPEGSAGKESGCNAGTQV